MKRSISLRIFQLLIPVSLIWGIISNQFIVEAFEYMKEEELKTQESIENNNSEILMSTNIENKNITERLPESISTSYSVENEVELISKENETLQYKQYSNEEIMLLAKITYAESGICSEIVQQNVAATVIARSKEWNKTITEVIFDDGQFRPAIGDEIYIITEKEKIIVDDVKAKRSLDAVYAAIDEGATQGVKEILGGEPLYFYAPSGCTSDALKARETIPISYEIEGVVFYRERG